MIREASGNPRRLSIWWPSFVTFPAIQLQSQCRLPPFRCNDPRPAGPGRIVAYVLVVPALQACDPVLLEVLVKRDDPAFHRGAASTWVQ